MHDMKVEPYEVAEDTFVIGQLHQPPGAPVGIYLNSIVIRGEQPAIVDTGTYFNRDQWLEDAFSLVDPVEVRWVYLSHDDHDHVGNLRPVLDAAPNATLVTTWFMVERLSADFELPIERMRWLNDGESIDAGDRRLTAVRPPLFDSPTTRGLFDDRTGFYWAVDSFASVLPNPAVEAADVDRGEWTEGFAVNRMNSPWHQWLDHRKFGRHVDRVQGLGASAIASAHGPALHGEMIDEAFRLIREVPHLEAPPLPGQADLDAIVASLAPPKELLATA
jgi:flavorubredoxin